MMKMMMNYFHYFEMNFLHLQAEVLNYLMKVVVLMPLEEALMVVVQLVGASMLQLKWPQNLRMN
jgi:hypothetical protein